MLVEILEAGESWESGPIPESMWGSCYKYRGGGCREREDQSGTGVHTGLDNFFMTPQTLKKVHWIKKKKKKPGESDLYVLESKEGAESGGSPGGRWSPEAKES